MRRVLCNSFNLWLSFCFKPSKQGAVEFIGSVQPCTRYHAVLYFEKNFVHWQPLIELQISSHRFNPIHPIAKSLCVFSGFIWAL